MGRIALPTFLEAPEEAWVRCNEFRALPHGEVACEVPRVENTTRIVIVDAKFFDEAKSLLAGMVLARENGNSLVEFSSGDRVSVPTESVEA